MSVIDSLQEAFSPHASRLNQTIANAAVIIDKRLKIIERALVREDIYEHWQRFIIKRKFSSGEEFIVAEAPMNEMFAIQAISSDGVQEKSPAYVILANGILIESVIKEGLGFEGVSGSQVVLPGETLSIVARAEGNINCVFTVIRKPYTYQPLPRHAANNVPLLQGSNTHEPERDLIATAQDRWQESPRETGTVEKKPIVVGK
jgi:hypothetical protein